MDISSEIPLLEGIRFARNELTRFIPQPGNTSGTTFRSIVSSLGRVASGAVEAAAGGLDLEYQALLQEQLEVQRQMFLMSLYSNLEKSRHETEMAAVRNIRVG